MGWEVVALIGSRSFGGRVAANEPRQDGRVLLTLPFGRLLLEGLSLLSPIDFPRTIIPELGQERADIGARQLRIFFGPSSVAQGQTGRRRLFGCTRTSWIGDSQWSLVIGLFTFVSFSVETSHFDPRKAFCVGQSLPVLGNHFGHVGGSEL